MDALPDCIHHSWCLSKTFHRISIYLRNPNTSNQYKNNKFIEK